MKQGVRWSVFALLVLAQLYVPYAIIGQHERVLSEGALVKIRCQPVDPADLFRGRYVWLSLDLGEGRLPPGQKPPESPRDAFAMLEPDADGFVRWGEVFYEQPSQGIYVKTQAMPYWSEDGETVYVEQPLDRFYMNESAAPEAEAAYNAQIREAPENCYISARVLEGMIQVEELYLDGMPIGEFVRTRP